MAKFAVPRVGDVITVTTCYKNNSVINTDRQEEITYENVPVIESPEWARPGEFCIPAKNEPFITFRTINIDKVTDLVIHNNANSEVEESTWYAPIQGSGDKIYSVLMVDGIAKDCDCLGFQHRGQCRHLRIAMGETPVNPRRETVKKRGKRATDRRNFVKTLKHGAPSKAEAVRKLIHEAQEKRNTEYEFYSIHSIQEVVIKQAIERLSMKSSLARTYVCNNWNKVWNFDKDLA